MNGEWAGAPQLQEQDYAVYNQLWINVFHSNIHEINGLTFRAIGGMTKHQGLIDLPEAVM